MTDYIRNRKNIKKIFLSVLGCLLVISLILSLTIGSVSINMSQTLKILYNHLPFPDHSVTWSMAQENIVWDLRLPRVILAVIIGAMLSASGVAFQGILRNPLADPYILGISVGAAFGAAASILFLQNVFVLGQYAVPVFSFLGGILSLGFVLGLSKHHGQRNNEILILSGVVVQALLGAFLTFLISVSGQQMQQIIYWMMGSLANHHWNDILVVLPYAMLGIGYLFFQLREMNIIALGENAATHLGMDVEKKKIQILLAGSLLTAAAVSTVGIIGFVGLIIPHLIRLLVGPDHRVLFPVSTVAGSIFLLWSDTLARTLLPSREIPIGVITAFVGAPFFAYLLKKGFRRNEA